MKAETTFESFFGAPLRNSFRILSSIKTSLMLRGLLSIFDRMAATGAASGCQRPPPELIDPVSAGRPSTKEKSARREKLYGVAVLL